MKEYSYREIWSIKTGQLVRWEDHIFGYSFSPRRIVKILGPQYTEEMIGIIVIRTWPVVHLICEDIAMQRKSHSYCNSIRQEGDRYFDDMNSEYFFEDESPPGRSFLYDMFATFAEEEPYPFVEGLDYTRNIWKCKNCGDFNAPPELGVNSLTNARWHCTNCDKYGVKKIYVMPPRVIGTKQLGTYQYLMGYCNTPEQSGDLEGRW